MSCKEIQIISFLIADVNGIIHNSLQMEKLSNPDLYFTWELAFSISFEFIFLQLESNSFSEMMKYCLIKIYLAALVDDGSIECWLAERR